MRILLVTSTRLTLRTLLATARGLTPIARLLPLTRLFLLGLSARGVATRVFARLGAVGLSGVLHTLTFGGSLSLLP